MGELPLEMSLLPDERYLLLLHCRVLSSWVEDSIIVVLDRRFPQLIFSSNFGVSGPRLGQEVFFPARI